MQQVAGTARSRLASNRSSTIITIFTTSVGGRSPAKICPMRKKLRVQLVMADRSANKQVHDELNALALSFMDKLANGNYDPAVR